MTDFNNKKRRFPVFTIIKNIWRREGEKAAERKKTHTKKPPGYRSRSIGRIVFWVMFGFMFVVVIANVFSTETVESKSESVEVKVNEAASQEAVQYVKNFTSQYFTWEKGDNDDWIEDRQNRLKPFLVKGLDENGGLDVSKMEWSSTIDKMNLVKIEEKGDNKAFITLYVSSKFSKKTKTEEVVKKDDKEEKKEVEKEESKPFVQYFVVPVTYQNGTFGIYQLPKYTNVKEQTKAEPEERRGLTEYNGNRGKVESFLNTFFTSYSEDNSSKLSYMVEDGTRIQGLNGKMKFVSLHNTDIKTDKDGNIQTFSTIELQDQETGTIVQSDYSLVITKKQGRFLVKEINQ
ncbi:conjugal transfer protein [Priestia aryabhattai]|uniref:conjugal transfer protein n=1 Tax=Priestia aryabhattai TaxID=412384 RepID=UPI002E23F067|nr:conjugal transfer protein [Priestia aryabhattai]